MATHAPGRPALDRLTGARRIGAQARGSHALSTASGHPETSHPWAGVHRSDPGRQTAGSAIEAIGLAVVVWFIGQFALLTVMIMVGPGSFLDGGELEWVGVVAGVVLLALGVPLGMRKERLSGWKTWLLVAVGSFALVAFLNQAGTVASLVVFVGVLIRWAYRRGVRRDTPARNGQGRGARSSTRHKIADGRVALRLPDDWQVIEGDMLASTVARAQPAAPVAAEPAASGDRRVRMMAWREEDGIKLEIESTGARDLEAVASEVLAKGAPADDLHSAVEYLSLPAGRAARLKTTDDARGRQVISTRYVLVNHDRTYQMVFASPDPPQDRWLSIAESFEFLPAEE